MKNMLASYWKNKSVLITGASSGLGWAITEALAPYQVNFCLLSRREEKLNELAQKLKATGSSFMVKACDVRNRDQISAAIKEFHNQTGRIDAAWVNSGIVGDSSFPHWNWESIEAIIDTNLKGAIYTIRACLELMVPQNSGTIIGIGSAASMRGLPTRGIYGLTKAGLEFFMESLAAELPQIQFTVIHPGFVDTPINQKGSSNRIWLMTPEKAAQIMIKAAAKRKKVFIYPFRMKLLYRLARLVPASVYPFIAQKTLSWHRKKKREARGNPP